MWRRVFGVQLEEYTNQVTALQRQLTQLSETHESELNELVSRQKEMQEVAAEDRRRLQQQLVMERQQFESVNTAAKVCVCVSVCSRVRVGCVWPCWL